MSGSSVLGCLLVMVLGLAACGGNTAEGSGGAAGGAADTGGAGTTTDECAGGAAGEGSTGERPLEAYARLRTACDRGVKINRQGMPVPVDDHIR